MLSLFESKLASMLSEFTDKTRELFARARGADTRYFRKLSELGERMEEEAFSASELGSVNKNKVGPGLSSSELAAQNGNRVSRRHCRLAYFALFDCRLGTSRPTWHSASRAAFKTMARISHLQGTGWRRHGNGLQRRPGSLPHLRLPRCASGKNEKGSKLTL